MFCAIPIEIFAREMDGALYLALRLAAAGLPTVLGERMVDRYVLDAREPVVYFDSDHSQGNDAHVLARGGLALDLHPEGLNLLDSPQVLTKYLGMAPYASHICTWGRVQAEHVRAHLPPESRHLVQATGHPAFDLTAERFLPYYRNPEIVAEHGEDFVLINTNFSYHNHLMGMDRYVDMLGRTVGQQIFTTPEHLAFVRRLAAYQARLLPHFVDLARSLAQAFPERHVILRPHPTEGHGYYRERLADLPNVFVRHTGSVRQWIASAGTVIHHDCTSGIEALLMGRPTVQFRPVYDPEIAATIPSLAGLELERAGQVADVVRAGAVPAARVAAQREALGPYFANLEQEAVQVLAGFAAGALSGSAAGRPQPLGPWENLKCWRKHLSKVIRARQPGRNGRKVRHALGKFPRVGLAVMQDKLDRLAAVCGESPRPRLTSLALNTFLVEPGAS